jgi:ferrous iron transport protein B
VTRTLGKTLTVAVAGNPNSGKTTIFNNLTGARQHVGNYPGVTVEWKKGTHKRGDVKLDLVDLPGTYSLTAFSEEELVARDYLLNSAPDVVVDVVDAANLERNLFLTTELLEIGVPLVIVLNMTDVARSRGLQIDAARLAEKLGVPVVPAIGNKGVGMDDLVEAIMQVAISQASLPGPAGVCGESGPGPASLAAVMARGGPSRVNYGPQVEKVISEIEDLLPAGNHRRWQAIKLVGGDEQVIELLALPGTREAVAGAAATFADETTDEPDIGWLSVFMSGLWAQGSTSPLRSLIVDGIIGGVGGVIVFLPNIVLLFMAIAVLEGTGYMARAAFVMDRFMSKVGLHGKSFIPLLIGFGCTVPAIMATRTLETRRDRLITMMVLPLMSCGARLPIYALIIPAFFPARMQGPALWLIYVTGILLALGGAHFLRATLFRGATTPFLMELPPYRMPTMISLLVQMWTRAWLYVKKAGTVILGAAIILWFLTFYPKPPADYVLPVGFEKTTAESAMVFSEIDDPNLAQSAELSYSIAGRVGRLLEPAIAPLGFDWRIGTALVGAIAAKEVFVAQMGIVFAVGEADETSDQLRAQLRDRYTPLIGFCIMLFALISTPCIATFAITRQEAGSIKWAFAQTFGLTALAWIVTFAVYQGGLLLGFGGV